MSHIQALNSDGIQIVSAISVVNYDKDNMDDVVTNLLGLKKYSKVVEEYNVKMISYIDLPKNLHNLSH